MIGAAVTALSRRALLPRCPMLAKLKWCGSAALLHLRELKLPERELRADGACAAGSCATPPTSTLAKRAAMDPTVGGAACAEHGREAARDEPLEECKDRAGVAEPCRDPAPPPRADCARTKLAALAYNSNVYSNAVKLRRTQNESAAVREPRRVRRHTHKLGACVRARGGGRVRPHVTFKVHQRPSCIGPLDRVKTDLGKRRRQESRQETDNHILVSAAAGSARATRLRGTGG